MKALTSPSSGIILEGYGGKWSSSSSPSPQRRGSQACFLRPQKAVNFGFLNLVSGKESKILHPIDCVSSNIQVGLGTEDAQVEEMYQSKTVHVKFQLQRKCVFGEQFFIVGDEPMFGSWEPESAIPLNWSDEHLWSVELDVPVGRSIQFKLILKSSSGKFLWQPGPDRIFKTWGTENTIIVCEDWENAEYQKIMEQDQAGSTTNISETKTVVDNLTQLEVEMLSNVMKSDIDANSAQRASLETKTTKLIADGIASVQEKPKRTGKSRSTELSKEKRVKGKNSAFTPKKDSTGMKNIIKKNGSSAAKVNTSETEDIMEKLIDYEGDGHVLVPGLPPVTPNEEENEVEKRIALEGSNGAFEAKDHNLPEKRD